MKNITNITLFAVIFCIVLSLLAIFLVNSSRQNMQTKTQQFDAQVASLQSTLKSFLTVKIPSADKECSEETACSDLQRGSSGENVRILQMFLKKYPELYPEGAVSGFYDGYTESAVKRLQMQCNVKPNGVISPQIVHIMKEVYICDVLEVCGILAIGNRGAGNKGGVVTVGPCPPEK